MGSDVGALRTLASLAVVFGNQATIYANRERRRRWSSRASSWLVISSVADMLIASTLAVAGIAMAPSPLTVVDALAAAIAFAIIPDLVKVPVFPRLGIA